jgi:hypothetical protein
LSFSTEPLAELKTNSFGETYILDPVTGVVSQQLITLRILNKVSTTTEGGGLQTEWQLWQPAFLPKIEHGDEEHSIVLEHVTANHVELVSPTDASVSLGVVPAVATPESPDSAGTYRLTFTFGQKKAVESPENPEEPV